MEDYSYLEFDETGKKIVGCMSFVKKVEIPNSVTSIGEFAFCTCSSLISIEIPNSVITIERHAFCGCSSLTSIEIPNSVTSIEEGAFSHCPSLSNIYVSESHTHFTVVDGVLYSKDLKILVCCPSGIQGRCKIPSQTIIIFDEAFKGCCAITAIEIPNTLRRIGCDSFANCTLLKDIYEYESQKHLTIIDGVLYSKDLTQLVLFPFGRQGKFKVPDHTIEICDLAFAFCSSIISVEIPNSVVKIGKSAFNECTSLSSIVISNGVKSIGDYAFHGCSSLTSIEIPTSVMNIGKGTFANSRSFMDWERRFIFKRFNETYLLSFWKNHGM